MVTVFAQGLLAVVFAASLVGKVRDMERFTRTIMAFDLLPPVLSTFAARMLAAAEAILVVVLLVSLWPPVTLPAGVVAVTGLLLVAVLLVTYTVALIIVKVRQTRVSCNCFGTSATMVSWADVIRNGLLLLVAGLGLAWDPAVSLSVGDRALLVLAASPVALLLINFADVVSVTRKSFIIAG
jgi:hypothetical protein